MESEFIAGQLIVENLYIFQEYDNVYLHDLSFNINKVDRINELDYRRRMQTKNNNKINLKQSKKLGNRDKITQLAN